jgi:hypothetical protein
MEVDVQEQFAPSMAALGQKSTSAATVIVQLSELSCRMDRLEEHWNDPEAVRSRLAQLATAQLATPMTR